MDLDVEILVECTNCLHLVDTNFNHWTIIFNYHTVVKCPNCGRIIKLKIYTEEDKVIDDDDLEASETQLFHGTYTLVQRREPNLLSELEEE